jgi:hypothetical protein
MFSKWNRGLIDIFKEEYVSAVSKTSNKDDKDPSNAYVTEFWNKRFASFGLTAPQDIADDVSTPDACAISGEVIDKNLKTVSEFYKYCQSQIQLVESRYASPTAGFIPISLSLTFDGMSGFKIYNSVNVNTSFLPRNYPDSLNFIVKGVTHKLSGHSWETSLDTVVIAQNADKNGNPFLRYTQIRSEVKKIINKAQVKIAAENSELPPDVVSPPKTNSSGGGVIYGSTTVTSGQKADNVRQIASYLKSIGFTKEGTIGLLGNILGESGANPRAAERNIAVGGLGGIGIVQWTASRRRKLEAEASNDNNKILDLNFQLIYLV